jgi:hypothetical protein
LGVNTADRIWSFYDLEPLDDSSKLPSSISLHLGVTHRWQDEGGRGLRETEKKTSRKMLAWLKRSYLLMIPITLGSGKGRESGVLLGDKW